MTNYYPSNFCNEYLLDLVRQRIVVDLHSAFLTAGYTPPNVVALTRYEGRPTAIDAGFQEFFISQHITSQEPGDTNNTNDGLHELINFEIVLTQKLSHVPSSKIAEKTMELNGLADNHDLNTLAQWVKIRFHNSGDLIGDLNSAMAGFGPPQAPAVYQPYFVAPRWAGTSVIELKGPEWCLGLDAKQYKDAYFAVCRVRFSGLERIQCSVGKDIM